MVDISGALNSFLLSQWEDKSETEVKATLDVLDTDSSLGSTANSKAVNSDSPEKGLLSDILKDSIEITQFNSMVALESLKIDGITTKEGSLEFQEHLSNMIYSDVRSVFKLIKDDLLAYSLQNFSNYCVFSLVQRLQGEERWKTVVMFSSVLVKMATNNKSSIIVQYLVRTANEKEAAELYKAISGKILKLAKNAYGCYCLQYLVEVLTEEDRQTLFCEVYSNIKEIAQHKKGHFIVNETFKFSLSEPTIEVGKQKVLENLEFLKENETSREVLCELISHLGLKSECKLTN